jgi:threonine 3-dehydrogenase
MKMKVVTKSQKSLGFTYSEKAIPDNLLPNEVLIKVKTVSVCGTDVHIYNWDKWSQNRIKPPVTVGHEFAGQVIEVGEDVTLVKEGDLVSSESHIICGKCEYCQSGNGHVCPNTKLIGVDIDGCFAEYVKVPEENLYIDKSGLNPIYLSVLEPLGNAVHAVTHFDVKDKVVVIIGAGPIGLMGIDVARASGARQIIVTEINEYRINLAKELGADYVLNPTKEDVVSKIRSLTNGEGCDVAVDFSGSIVAINQALDYLKPNGALSILGVFRKNIDLDLNKIVFKGLHIYGVTGRRIPETWNQLDELLQKKALNFDKFVTHQFKFSEMEEAVKIMREGKSGKVVLTL